MLLKRSTKKELMDDFSITDERIDSALIELKKINRFLGGFSVSKSGLRNFIASGYFSGLKVLDAGSGSSDILLKIKKRFNNINILSLDKNIRVCKYTKANGLLNIVCGDIFYLPFKKEYFDLVHASLFLHHFGEDELKHLLRNLLEAVKKGIIINELRRNVIALIGIKILTFFFSNSILVKNDAPLSVKKGFSKKELKDILSSLPSSEFSIKRKWAFRWVAVVFKNVQ